MRSVGSKWWLTCCGIVMLALSVFLGVMIYWAVVHPETFFGG